MDLAIRIWKYRAKVFTVRLPHQHVGQLSVARCAAWLGLALCGCLDPTQVELSISTNALCNDPSGMSPLRLNGMALVAGPPGELSQDPQATMDGCDDQRSPNLGTVVLFPSSDAKDASVLVVGALAQEQPENCLAAAQTLAAAPSCIVARRRVGFAAHRSLSLSVFLDVRCAGVVCDEGSTCTVGSDGLAVCVDATVECSTTSCELRSDQGSGGSNQGGGGAGEGGAPPAELEWPVVPATQDGARPTSVGDDGQVLGGFGILGNVVSPMAWRNLQPVPVEGLAGNVAEVCGNGDFLVGDLRPAGVPTATLWRFDPPLQRYVVAWQTSTPGETHLFDCDTTGTRLLGVAAGQARSFVRPTTVPTGQSSSTLWQCDGDCSTAIGSSPPNTPVQHPINAMGAISAPVSLTGEPGICFAIDAGGDMAACLVGEDLAVFRLQPTPVEIYRGATGFVPSAIARTKSGGFIVAGACDGFTVGRACVVVDGEGPFDLDARTGVPFPPTASLDFDARVPSWVFDMSTDGSVLVGEALLNNQLVPFSVVIAPP